MVIDNPELVAELHRIQVGTRPEIIALHKAEIDRPAADLTFAQQTYNRTRQLAAEQFAPQSKLDEDTDALTLAQRPFDQAKLAYQEAVRGFTAEEHQIAEANVAKAAAKVNVANISCGLRPDGAAARVALTAFSPAELLTEPLYNPWFCRCGCNHGSSSRAPALLDRRTRLGGSKA